MSELWLTHSAQKALILPPGDLAISRFVHPGYVSSWQVADREIAGLPNESYLPYVGSGLPEVFEMPLAWSSSKPGDLVMRIGAGQFRRQGDGWAGCPPLERVARCRVLAQSASAIEYCCDDQLERRGERWAYRLIKKVWLDAAGLHSRNQLSLSVPWSMPICWFAHPYLRYQSDHCAVGLPVKDCAGWPQADGLFSVPRQGGFSALTQLRDHQPHISYNLAEDCRVLQRCDTLLDKLVVYATEYAVSIEPYLSWTGHNGASYTWTLHYSLPS